MDEEIENLKLEIENINKRIDTLKKVIGDYMELSSSIALSSVKTNLKNL